MKSKKITILDGSLGTELRKRGVRVTDYKSSIWSAFALIDDPDAVIELHEDYINAGAEVITVNNYSLTRKLLKREKMEDRLEELMLIAINLAKEARENSGKDILIAGSLPPLDTTYRADLVGTYDDNYGAYLEMASILAPLVDFLICETLTTSIEAKAAVMAARKVSKKVWVSFTLDPNGNKLRGGESIEKAIFNLKDLEIDAFLFNCSAIKPVTQTIPIIKALVNVPIGVFANPVMVELGEGEPEILPTNPISPEEYAKMANLWVDLGATIIGGCCDTGPSHIKALSEAFKS